MSEMTTIDASKIHGGGIWEPTPMIGWVGKDGGVELMQIWRCLETGKQEWRKVERLDMPTLT